MREPTLYILDVGHGNSAVLVDTGGIVVIDAGSQTALLEFLKQEGISHVDVVLISHADKDHIEGLVSLIESEEFTIGRVRVNTDLMKGTRLWADLLYLLDKSHRAKKLDFDVALTTKNTGEFDQGLIRIEVLAPNLQVAGMGAGGGNHKKRVFRTNTVSAVIRLSKRTKPLALFAGDIDELGLEHLLGDFPAPNAPILVYPHHGGKSGAKDEASFTRRLCEAVNPRLSSFQLVVADTKRRILGSWPRFVSMFQTSGLRVPNYRNTARLRCLPKCQHT